MRYSDEYTEVRQLADGTKVRLALLRPSDRATLLAAFARLSEETRYRRFFTAMPELPERTLERLLATDGWNHLAIGAVDAVTGEGYGLARFMRLEEAPDVAEAAIVVVDDLQRRGLGKLLLTRLAAAAHERGITRFRAEVLRTNQAIVALLHDVDRNAQPAVDGPIAIYELTLPERTDAEAHGPLFGFLRLAAGGLQFLLRRLMPEPTPAAPPGPSRSGPPNPGGSCS
ncbi:MAG TPA: GNAT family N-acetyltransferase [Candidatus Binatia bacterium]|nr:GNAT family N-acetyltransferase [Candidatus Binatia bacterium]